MCEEWETFWQNCNNFTYNILFNLECYFPAFSADAFLHVPFCKAGRLESTHVYIVSEDYPGAMPGTDQDCSCEISPGEGFQAVTVNVTAIVLHLYGSNTDPCRERLTIYTDNGIQVICPEKIPTGIIYEYRYVSNFQVLLPHLQIKKASSLVIQLKTNSTLTSMENTGQVILAVSSYGAYVDYYTQSN